MHYEIRQFFPLPCVDKMSDLISKFNNLTLGSSEENKNTLHGCICKVKLSKMYFECENNYFVIPEQSGSKYILWQRKVLATDTFVLCLNCKNEFVYQNIKIIDNVRNLKNKYCQLQHGMVTQQPKDGHHQNEVQWNDFSKDNSVATSHSFNSSF